MSLDPATGGKFVPLLGDGFVQVRPRSSLLAALHGIRLSPSKSDIAEGHWDADGLVPPNECHLIVILSVLFNRKGCGVHTGRDTVRGSRLATA